MKCRVLSGACAQAICSVTVAQGQLVNSNTLYTMSSPVGTCQAKSARLMQLSAMWALRAVSLPFCICGTSAAARAHSTVMAAPAYRWGPGNSLPAAAAAGLCHAGFRCGRASSPARGRQRQQQAKQQSWTQPPHIPVYEPAEHVHMYTYCYPESTNPSNHQPTHLCAGRCCSRPTR